MNLAYLAQRRTRGTINAACLIWVTLAAVLAVPAQGWGGEGAIPMTLNYQGVYKEDGIPYNGIKSMTIRLTNQDGSLEYWASGPRNVAVSTGAFQVQLELGSTALPWGEITPYLEVSVGGTLLLPRQRIGSVVYAMYADEAETLAPSGGGQVDLHDDVIVSPGFVGIGSTRPVGPLHVNAAKSAGLVISTNGNVGIGTALPAERLDVGWDDYGSIRLRGVGSSIIFPDGSILSSAHLSQAKGLLNPYAVIQADSDHDGSGDILMMTGPTTRVFLDGDSPYWPFGPRVGINVPDPTGSLEVGGGVVVDSSLTVTSVGLAGTAPVFQVVGATFIVRVDGRVGIGTYDPQSALQVAGGYIQFPINTTSVPACELPDHGGRMFLAEGGARLWKCIGYNGTYDPNEYGYWDFGAAGWTSRPSGPLDPWDSGDNSGPGGTVITPADSEQSHGPHTLNASDPGDWFKIAMTAGTTYYFDRLGGYGEVCGLYSDAVGSSLVAENWDQCSLSYMAGNTQTYYLKLTSIYPWVGMLKYGIGSPPSSGDPWDPGDDTGGGGTVITPTFSEQSHGPHTLSSTDSYDYYRISMTAGTKYYFDLVTVSGSAGLSLCNDANCSSFIYLGTAGNYTAPNSQIYYLRAVIEAEAWSGSLRYRFALDPWDPGDDAGAGGTVITPTASQQSHGPHALSATDQADWYRISMTTGTVYYFDTIGGSSDVVCELYSDSGGTNLVASDNDSGGGGQCSLSYAAADTQTYYLKVRAFNPGYLWSGSLKYRYSTADPWDFGDDTGSGATAIIPAHSAQSHGPHTLSASDLADWYSIPMTAGTTYYFDTIGGAGDDVCTLYDDAYGSSLIASDDDSGSDGQCSLDYMAANTQTYYLKVRAFTAGNFWSGSLQYWDSAPGGDAWDPGDDAGAGGTAITPTAYQQSHGPHTLRATDLADWYSISMAAGSTYYFDTIGGSRDDVCELYSDVGGTNLVTSDDNSGGGQQCSLSHIAVNTQTYFLKVRAFTAGNVWSGSLKYGYREWDTWDPGDDAGAGSTTITPTASQQSHGPHTLRATDLTDWYLISMTAGTTYYFDTIGGNGDDYCELYSDVDGASLVASDDNSAGNNQCSLSYAAANTQTYYLKVRAFTPGTAWSGSLRYRYGAPLGDAWDSGDDAGAGGSMITPAVAQQYHGPHTLSETDLADWYMISMTAGTEYHFDTIGGAGDDVCELYSDAGGTSLVISDDNSGGGQQCSLDYTAANTQTYFLKVRAFTAGDVWSGNLRYRFAWWDAWDPGDDAGAGGTVITPTASLLSHGPHALSTTDLADWYMISMTAGTAYHIDTIGGSSGDDVCELYSDVGGTSLVTFDDNSGGDQQCSLNYIAANTQTYYLKVRAFTPGNIWLGSLKYKLYPPGGDAWDPGDDAGAGGSVITPVVAGQSHSPHTLSSTDLADWYSISMTAGTAYHFHTSGSGDDVCELYSDASGTNLVTSDDNSGGGQQCSLDYTAANTQTYYLKVRTFTAGDFWSGGLFYRYSTMDAWDPGDDAGAGGTAITPMAFEQSHGPHSLSAADLADWYSITMTAGTSYNFNTIGGMGNDYCELYSDVGGTNLVASDDNSGGGTGQCSLSYAAANTQTYYLKVRAFSPGGDWSGSLKYRYSPPDAWDPDDDAGAGGTAITPTASEQSHGPHTLNSTDLADWYSISMTAGTIYNFDTIGGSGDDVCELYSDVGGTNLVASNDDSGGNGQCSLSYAAANTQTYYLKVRAYTPGNAWSGSLKFRYAPSGDAWDPGDDGGAGGTAITPTTSEQSHGPHTLGSTDLADWYSISMAAGTTYNFDTIGGTGDDVCELYSDVGGSILVASDDDGGGGMQCSVSYAAANTQTYYLRVRAFTPGNLWSGSLKYRYTSP